MMESEFMKQSRKSKIGIWSFIIGVVLIGVMNVLDPVPDPYLTTLIFSVRTALYFVMLFLWTYTLRLRLVISRPRTYLSIMAGFIIALYAMQSIKYRVFDGNTVLMRYAWYSYYIPLMMVCILFLMACISFGHQYRPHRFDERWLVIPAAVFALLVLTNDLHHFFFSPIEGMPFDGGTKDYTNNIGFYFIYAYYIVCVALGLFFLVRAFRSRRELRKKTLYPFLFLIPWVIVNFVLYFVVIKDYTRHPYNINEIFIFAAIGVMEICIRCGLIPHNENYIGFFKRSRIPAVITDKELKPVYATDIPLNADDAALRKATEKPIYNSDTEIKISAKPVPGGYVFWATDETAVRRLNAELQQANHTLSTENDLLKAENELKSMTVALEERERIDRIITEKMRPYLTRIQTLLDSADSDSPDFRADVLRVSVLNCVVKRGTNMLLCADENGMVPAEELQYAIKELATVYAVEERLLLAVTGFLSFMLSADSMIALFDDVRLVLDALDACTAGEVGAVIADGSVVLITGKAPDQLSPTASAFTREEADGAVCLTLRAKGGEAL